MMMMMKSVRTLANMNYNLYASMGTADSTVNMESG